MNLWKKTKQKVIAGQQNTYYHINTPFCKIRVRGGGTRRGTENPLLTLCSKIFRLSGLSGPPQSLQTVELIKSLLFGNHDGH